MASIRIVVYVPEEKYHALWEKAASDQLSVTEYLKRYIDEQVAGSPESRLDLLIKKYSPFLVKEGENAVRLKEDFKEKHYLDGKRGMQVFYDLRDAGYLFNGKDDAPGMLFVRAGSERNGNV